MYSSRSWGLAFLQSLLVATELSRTCLAQNGVESTIVSTPSAQPSSTTSAPAQTHTIQVGLADHKFKPETTVANVGDTVEFAFYPRNHSVVRAEYGFPCIPYEVTGASKTGFFSGFQPVDKVLPSPPTYRIVINDTDPVFFYCSAPGSCLTYGMVGAINPNASTSIEEQQRLAKNSTYMLNPGEPFPAETPSPNNPPSSTTASNPGAENPNDKISSLSKRAIIAMIVTSVCITTLAALLFFFWGRTKGLKDELKRKATTVWRPEAPTTAHIRNMSIFVPRAELGNPEPNHNAMPYYYQYSHQPPPLDDTSTYPHQHYPQHPTFSPAPPQTMSLYCPPPPPSSPSPLPHKINITSPLDQHPAYSRSFQTPQQPPVRHELDSQKQNPDAGHVRGEGDAKMEPQCQVKEVLGAEGTGEGERDSEDHDDMEIERVPSYADALCAAAERAAERRTDGDEGTKGEDKGGKGGV